MPPDPGNPLIVQSDRTLLLEVDNPLYPEARDHLARFAELEKSPEHFHTYRITALSLWNAAAAGLSADEILASLERFTKYEVPSNIRFEVADYVARYGHLKLERRGDELVLVSPDAPLIAEVSRHPLAKPFLLEAIDFHTLRVRPDRRGHIKQALIRIGYPVEDLAGYVEGAPLAVELRQPTLEGLPFVIRAYQREAADVFYAGGAARGGSGVVVLPCGAGKTIVGIACMAACKTHTLILCTSITAVRQWQRELLDKTTLVPDQIGEYSGEIKERRPVTVTTYQILTYRRRKNEGFPHFEIFNAMNWGLIIYDEVHLLPAPVFRITAEIQSRRRLGLTATLVREDKKEDDVFSLIGPKRYDVPWKVLEKQGWIATAACTEVRVALPDSRCPTTSAWTTRWRTTARSSALRPRARPSSPSSTTSSGGTATTWSWSSANTCANCTPSPGRPARPSSPAPRRRASATSSTTTFATGASRCSSSRRSGTSPLTCPTPTSWSR
jgi:DNA excision repair protein ERCC-3